MEKGKNSHKEMPNPEHLAKKYSKYGSIFLVTTILCVAVFFFCMFYPIQNFGVIATLVILEILLVCGFSPIFLSIFSVICYARADFYKSLIDGKDRRMRWVRYAFYSFVLFSILLLSSFLVPSVSTTTFILSIFSILGAMFIGMGYYEYIYERKRYFTSINIKMEDTEGKGIFRDEISIGFGAQILAIGFLIFLFLQSLSTYPLFALLYLFMALFLSHQIWKIYSKFGDVFSKSGVKKERLSSEELATKLTDRYFRTGVKIMDSIFMSLNYVLWLAILYSIKTIPLPINCAGVWLYINPNLMLLLLGVFLAIFFTHLWSNISNTRYFRALWSFLFLYILLILSILSSSGIATYCECSNPDLITEGYFQATALFIFDTAFKAVIVTGIIDSLLKKQKKR